MTETEGGRRCDRNRGWGCAPTTHTHYLSNNTSAPDSFQGSRQTEDSPVTLSQLHRFFPNVFQSDTVTPLYAVTKKAVHVICKNVDSYQLVAFA